MGVRTVIIKPGETVILPKDATITSLVLDGAINVESSCNNLPLPSSYKCGYFRFIVDADANAGHPMDMNTLYEKLVVGTNTYTIEETTVYGSGNAPTMTPISILNLHVPDQALFSFTGINAKTVDARMIIHLYFKVVESLFNNVELEIDNRNDGASSWYRPIEYVCDSYPEPE